MPRVRGSGKIERASDGRYLVRVSYVDSTTGKRRDVRRFAKTKTAAEKLQRAILDDAEKNEGRGISHERKTFAELARYYEERYAREAEYVDGRKVGGLRSVRTVRQQLGTLRDHFGSLRLRVISAPALEDFKRKRLATPARTTPCHTCKGKKPVDGSACEGCNGARRVNRQRTIATVNRELALLRRMLNVAVKLDWIDRNPFSRADKLISTSDERQRERILTTEEERRLLAAARGTAARETLRAIIVCALDTAMRQGEILKLRWSDVDLRSGIITVRAFNTKTMQMRTVRMTPRLTKELQRLQKAKRSADELVFGIVDNVKRSFTTVRKLAGLEDVRFHDLRHTAATRLVAGHLPLAEVGRILGHTQPKTTYRYVNATSETLDRAAAIFDAFHRAAEGESD